ncbi:50S ribosomal protein L17 [Planctomycetota bacterium]|nr:50S ribosomal protein L17 [Planctomycetota bacterium]MSR39338.1 50S ribosomal protein L17 [Planctomycetota bacterium]GDY01016.1 50S ribosomal protein L17 [Planctomycetota bacterium]
MKHNVAGKSLQRNSAHRAALRMNFTVSLLTHERVVTTLPKAKALRPFVEKVITLGKNKTLASIRRAVALLQDKTVVKKLFDEIGPRFATRQGGYTRIMRLSGYRPGDGGSKAILELVDNKVLETKMKAAEVAAVATEGKAKRKGSKA